MYGGHFSWVKYIDLNARLLLNSNTRYSHLEFETRVFASENQAHTQNGVLRALIYLLRLI
jgi:hypothetical protein